MEHEDREIEKDEHYMAIIASEVRRSWVKDPHKILTSDFLLKRVDEATKVEPKRKLTPEQRLAVEKASWGLILRKPPPKVKAKLKGKKNASPATTANPRRKNDA